VRTLYDSKGHGAARVTSHPSKASFRKASSVPLNTGSSYLGSSLHEHEYQMQGSRHVRVGGHQLLGTVSFDGVANSGTAFASGNEAAGCILNYGTYALTPSALGGLLDIYAKEFAQSQFNAVRILYIPQVPATEPGSIAMSFSPDITEPAIFSGEATYRHESTKTFVSGSVFEPLFLDLDPAETLNEYFNSEKGEFEMSTQGVIKVLSGGGLSPPTTAPWTKTLGHLYIEFDVDFSSPELAQDFGEVITAEAVLTFEATTAIAMEGAVHFTTDGGVTTPFLSVSGLALSEFNRFIWYGNIASVSEQIGGTYYPQFSTLESDENYAWEAGSGVYLRAWDDQNGYLNMVAFESLSAAQDFVSDEFRTDLPTTTGQYVWTVAIGAPNCNTFMVLCKLRALELSPE